MNNKGFQKSTLDDIKVMARLHQEGMTNVAIGKILKKDNSTIFYWLKKIKDFKPEEIMEDIISCHPKKKKEKIDYPKDNRSDQIISRLQQIKTEIARMEERWGKEVIPFELRETFERALLKKDKLETMINTLEIEIRGVENSMGKKPLDLGNSSSGRVDQII